MTDTTNLCNKKKPETLEETTLRICTDIMEFEGNYELAREFRYASSKDVLSPKARKIYNREASMDEKK